MIACDVGALVPMWLTREGELCVMGAVERAVVASDKSAALSELVTGGLVVGVDFPA